jgi:NAD(P)-dependent dehydrogenase (short-subunit alcohol dehydrogenase family)
MPTILITGAGRGIGLELARVFGVAGYQVITTVRNAAQCKSDLSFSEIIETEVTDAASVLALGRALQHRTLDILINNAGIIGPENQSVSSMDFEGFSKTLEVNTIAPLRIVQALLPALQKSTNGKIITISSNMGSLSYAMPDHIAYRASKAAANKVVQCLASELESKGIAVASIHPGWVRTDMGGGSADIDVQESAAGIKAVVEKLSLQTTGKFWNYDGSALAW